MSKPNPRSCPSCGQVVEPRARFCPRCGHALPPTAPPVRARRIAILVGLALVLAGVVAALVVTHGRSAVRGGPDGSARAGAPGAPRPAASEPAGGSAPAAADGVATPTDDPPPVANPNGPSDPLDDVAPSTLTGTLEFGDAQAVASASLGSSGGTIGGDGISVEFPPGSLPATARVTITSALVRGTTLPAFMRPATSLFTVELDGTDLETPAAVTLPMTIAPGELPMASGTPTTAA